MGGCVAKTHFQHEVFLSLRPVSITNNDSFYNFTGPTIRLLPCAPEEGVDRRLSFLGRHVLRAEHLEIMPISRKNENRHMGCPANSRHAYFFGGRSRKKPMPITEKVLYFCDQPQKSHFFLVRIIL